MEKKLEDLKANPDPVAEEKLRQEIAALKAILLNILRRIGG